jgi:hypothetical protein
LQHTPSTQPPALAHSRQPAIRQSAPAALLQVTPAIFTGWQVELAAQ